MSEFKKCTRGHVYASDLDECPYCGGKELDEELENLERKEIDLPEAAMCYDMSPRGLDEDDEKPEVPLPPTCYMPRPPKFDI